MNNSCGCNSASKLMRKIQQHSFAIVEATLYLDCHPNCAKALEYFKRHKIAYNKYIAEYEANYGPLTANVGANCESWNWIQGPWPWEMEA